MPASTFLYRPVNQQELDLIAASSWRSFPPRLPEQPIFYPVLNKEYASQISRDWNVPHYGVGYVVRFAMDNDYLKNFPVHNVGDQHHDELWIPADQLVEFNHHIDGLIEVIAEFRRS